MTRVAVATRLDRQDLRAVRAASWWLVRRPGLLMPLPAGCVLMVTTAPALDDGYALQVLRGVSVLLACALVASSDDPSGEVLAASPYPRSVRTAARALARAAVVVPAWALAAALAEWRAPYLPVLGVAIEALALGAVDSPSGEDYGRGATSTLPRSSLPWASSGSHSRRAPRPAGTPCSRRRPGAPLVRRRWLGLLLVGLGIAVLAALDPLVPGWRRRPRA
jgi:hypothetical protein